MIAEKTQNKELTRNGHVERFGREKGLHVEEIEVVVIDEIGEQLVGHSVQRRHDRKRQVPLAVRRPVDEFGVCRKKKDGQTDKQTSGQRRSMVDHGLPFKY